MTKIDKRKKYSIVLDCETANTMEKPYIYDIGFIVRDTQGNVIHKFSYLIEEIFCHKDLMLSAYYYDKVPLYLEKLQNNEIKMVKWEKFRAIFFATIRQYNIREFYAYNASFDFYKALNATQEYFTHGKQKYFFTYQQNKAITIKCIWHMATQTVFKQKTFIKWALENGYYSDKRNILTNAETCYKWFTKNEEFEEEHTALSDTLIESEILTWCKRQKKAMKQTVNSKCWKIPQEHHKETIKQYFETVKA